MRKKVKILGWIALALFIIGSAVYAQIQEPQPVSNASPVIDDPMSPLPVLPNFSKAEEEWKNRKDSEVRGKLAIHDQGWKPYPSRTKKDQERIRAAQLACKRQIPEGCVCLYEPVRDPDFPRVTWVAVGRNGEVVFQDTYY